ncbi:ZIP family metal transporter [Cytobacillus spongiae]|jgi:ZIP family zinc transporter|uniref:ZIP family metal transporter n=1 Tax=Cytobacillus spongiae TaxID=2901381 RepID=UPI001F23D9BD|nr:ZIP family metal transporter [Cytobacillus spongiae]UII54265.1 ZIP family metal transporter [Cytobacillus spongiae]
MVQAALWGAVASFSLFIGSIVGIYYSIPKKIIAYIMAFGTGVLLGASTFELLLEAVKASGIPIAISSFLAGAFVFTLLELFLYKKGGSSRKRSQKNPAGHSGLAIYFGTLMDAIPESIIIGISLLHNYQINWLFILAIFISNFPESLSSTIGLRKDGYSKKKVLFLWFSVVVLSSICSVIGFTFLKDSPKTLIAAIGAFGAGGLIAMVCSTMLPEAFEEGGPVIGFIASVGIAFSLVLSEISL